MLNMVVHIVTTGLLRAKSIELFQMAGELISTVVGKLCKWCDCDLN
jgi:hypothetical protein